MTKNEKEVLFIVESGKPLATVKRFLSEVQRVKKDIAVLANELGVTEGYIDRRTGILDSVYFPKEIHPDFTKPKGGRNRYSSPKKGSEWEKRFAAQIGHPDQSTLIAETFNIPLRLGYKTAEGEGHVAIGSFLNECGFLCLSEEGPFAMWVPDIPSIVKEYQEMGYTVEEPMASFHFEFEGCRRISYDEWDIMVMERDLAEAKAKLAESKEMEPA